MNRLLSLALLFLLQVPALASVPDWRQTELLRIYKQALDVFHSEALYIDFGHLDGDPLAAALLVDLDDAPTRAERTGAASQEVDPQIVGALERLILPLVWDLQARQTALPPAEVLERWMEANPSLFERPARVEGARILVETTEVSEHLLETLTAELDAMEENGETFRDVALRFYRARGLEMDGYFGWRGADRLRADLFEVFWNANADAPWFGPIEVEHGMMFGTLLGREEGGMVDFEEWRTRVESAWLSEHYQEWRETFLSLEEAERGLVRHWPAEGMATIPTPDDPAFELDGRVYTWRDVREWTPGVFGDDTRPEFYPSIGRRAVQNFLVYTGARAREVRASEDFQRVYNATLAHWKMARAMNQELAGIDAPPDAIEEFYALNRERLYTTDRVYSAIVWRFPLNPEGHRNPALVNESRKDAWRRAHLAREALGRTEDPSGEELDQNSFGPFERHDPGGWYPADVLPPPLGAIVDDAAPAPGWISPVAIGRDVYLLCLVREVREPEPIPFEEVIDRVWRDWRTEQQQQIRARYRMPDGATDRD